MKSRLSYICVAMLVVLLSGCTTMSDVKAARGSGHTRIVSSPIRHVAEIIPAAIRDAGLELVSQNFAQGEFAAQRKAPWWLPGDDGELVAVFVTPVDERHSSVEVVAKNKVQTQVWLGSSAERLLNAIVRRAEELARTS